MRCPVLVGRSGQVASITTALDRASRGRGAWVSITGEAGDGKSRLVAEAVGWARGRGGRAGIGASRRVGTRAGGAAVARMAGVVGCDEGSLAEPVDQRPALARLQAVMVRTQGVEEVQDGDMGPSPIVSVVHLEAGRGRAALDGAGGIEPLEAAPLVCVGPSPEVGDARELLPLCEDGDDERVTVGEDFVDCRHRHRAVADQVARLALDWEPAQKCFKVNPQKEFDGGASPRPTPDFRPATVVACG